MPQAAQNPVRPLKTLNEITRTPILSTREKMQLLHDLRREATLAPSPRTALGFDVDDVDRAMANLRRRAWKGLGPRIERQGGRD